MSRKYSTICEIPIPWDSFKADVKKIPAEIQVHLVNIISTLKVDKDFCENFIENSLLRLEACLDRTWESLNSGYWKDVPIEYRYSYSLCSILKSLLKSIHYEITEQRKDSTGERKVIKEIIEQIDRGILLGAPLPQSPHLLTNIASKLNSQYVQLSSSEGDINSELSLTLEDISNEMFPGFCEVKRYKTPSMETFFRDIFRPKAPAILEDCLTHWKALELWQNPRYLIKIAGNRTVPIEIGSRYTDEDWTQSLVTFNEFLGNHVCKKADKIGYLAQHQLFDQIPELKNDFAVPEYCNFSDKDDEDSSPDINAWFGPGGTVSPLHFDPKNNLLCQVFGYKRIILYSPDDTANLYPFETKLLFNTSQVDPVNPDFTKFPNFVKCRGRMCYLKPGEMLYIPPTWWHHVVSLSPSFSISFWWN